MLNKDLWTLLMDLRNHNETCPSCFFHNFNSMPAPTSGGYAFGWYHVVGCPIVKAYNTVTKAGFIFPNLRAQYWRSEEKYHPYFNKPYPGE